MFKSILIGIDDCDKNLFGKYAYCHWQVIGGGRNGMNPPPQKKNNNKKIYKDVYILHL